MKRGLLALVFACAVLSAQEPAAPPPPTRQFQPPESWLNFNFGNVQPRRFTLAVQPGTFALAMESPPRSCSVPLLEVPVNPDIDPKISPLKTPAENIDKMPIAKGLLPCPSPGSQPEVLFLPRSK